MSLLRSMLTNASIAEGSLVLFADAHSPNYVMLQKCVGQFLTYAYGPRKSTACYPALEQLVSLDVNGQDLLISRLISDPDIFAKADQPVRFF